MAKELISDERSRLSVGGDRTAPPHRARQRSYLKQKINSLEDEHISQVKTAPSTADNLIQLADYAAGIVARAFEEGDAEYQTLIQCRLVVRLWPE